MRRSMPIVILVLAIIATALWSCPASAQTNAQLGPLCTSTDTPSDEQIDARNRIIALKVFSGEKLAAIYFWRAVEVQQMLTCVRAEVVAATRSRQVPWSKSPLLGEVYLAAK